MGKPVRCVKRLMEIVVIWIAYPHWAIWPWRSDIMVVNEVVLRVHTTYKNDIENIKNINIWIIQEADNVLNEILDNNTSDNVSYEELVNSELGQLEEEYTIDGGGDLVMTDELDDYNTDFGVEEIILSTKGENDFIDKLDISKVKLKDSAHSR